MVPKISVGIDIGSRRIKVLVTDCSSKEQMAKPRIIGAGYALSKGIRHGYIENASEAEEALQEAISQAEKSAGIKITKAYLAAGGIGLSSAVYSSAISLNKENEVTGDDIRRVKEECENNLPESFTLNHDIIHAISLQFKLDGKAVLGRVQGLKGSKLEVKMLFVTILTEHLKDLVGVVNACGVAVEDVMAAPIAGSLSTLSKSQQIAGCALLNIGAETVSVSVFENNTPISLEVFQIGGNDITNDIALGLRVPLEDAERIKLSKPESVPYPRKKIEEIIGARLSDIFELVSSHLKKIGRSGLLPAGVVITGEGALLPQVEQLAKDELKIGAKRSALRFDGETKLPIKEGSWSIAYGLCILGASAGDANSPVNIFGMKTIVYGIRTKFKTWINKFLP